MNQKLAYASAVLALLSVALMAWSALHPSPLAIVLGLTMGQAVGTIALVILIIAIVLELRRVGLLARRRQLPT